MGTVFLAEQIHPVRRKVALKIIKPGMDTKQVIARFEAERQALALMDHPNIARVLDAGATPEGRPYFAMELVKGLPITRYCDERRLPVRERLELFVPVCQAVQHAHQKGIIHRDIKPSNVLVAPYDGVPVVKVIDFGVAKAAGQPLTERTLATGFGSVVGTLEYMSPEQAELNNLDIDTRSDIYALGVLLYELLTGTTPLQKKRLESAAFAEVLRIIREEEPPRPSMRLSTTEELPSIAANRGAEPAKLSGLVRGELDWIVMKALEKDRSRRYETANGLAMDVQRHLADEPVQACPPSAGYWLRKFARRNKVPVLAALLVALAMVIGIIGATWGMVRARIAEAAAAHEASQKALALRDREKALAPARASEAKAVESLKDSLVAVERMLTRVAQERLFDVPHMEPIRQELLQDALQFYQKFLQDQRDNRTVRRETALAHARLAGIQYLFARHADAEANFRRAFSMLAELEAEEPLDPALRSVLIKSHVEFSWTLGSLGKVEEQHGSLRRATRLAEELVAEFPREPAYLDSLVSARSNSATLFLWTRPAETERLIRQNLPLVKPTSPLAAGAYKYLGLSLAKQGRYPEADEAFNRAVECLERNVAESPRASWLRLALADTLEQIAQENAVRGRLEQAEGEYRRAIALDDQLAAEYPGFPAYRSRLAQLHTQRAGLLKKLTRTDKAADAFRRASALYDRLLAENPASGLYPQLVQTHVELGRLLASQGKAQEASTAYDQAIAVQRKLEEKLGGQPEHRGELANAHLDLGHRLREAGRLREATTSYRRAIELFAAVASDSPGWPGYRLHQVRASGPGGRPGHPASLADRG
jgi:tetratricopeptide (TPR) repeat protein